MHGTRHQRNPRLLLVTRALEVGGTERHLAQIAPGLAARGFDVTLYCISREGAQLADLDGSGLRLAGSAPYLKSLSRAGAAVSLATGALGLIPEMLLGRPDIAHFFLPHAFLAGSVAAAITQVPIRIMSRRCQNLYQTKHPRLARLEHRLHGSMTAVLGNSEHVLDELVHGEGVAPERAGLIHNGVDLARFSRAHDREAIRAALGIAPDATVIATLANLIPYKGHGDLLRALGRVRDQLPKPWHLLAMGRDDGALADLKNQAAALGLETNIHWLGSRRDVPELLQASDLGVLASHQEGFSNAVIESMAASLPMVVTNVGGNSEAVLHGLSGLVVPARNPARLGDAIAEIACDPERGKAMGEAGRIRAEQHFSLTACLDKYETMYRSLLAEQGLPRQIQSPSVMRRDETYGARARLSGAVAGYSLAAGHAREFATVTFAKTD